MGIEQLAAGRRQLAANLGPGSLPAAICLLVPTRCFPWRAWRPWRERSAMKSEDPPQMAGPGGPAHGELLREACAALLRTGQMVRFRATGLSMDPTIRDGDVLTVEPVDLGEVRPGEILLYRTERGVIAHRLMRREVVETQLLYILRGDASATCDPPVSYGDVLGLVTSLRRRRRSRSLTNPWTRQWHVTWAAATRLARAAKSRICRNSH